MASPRLHVASPPRPEPLPLSATAEVIREHLADRRQELNALCPEALDLAAQFLASLHESLRGHAVELRGTHSPEYRRQQLVGRSSLPAEGICYLALMAPAAVVEALGVLLGHLGYQVIPEPDGNDDVAAEGAGVARSGGQLTAELLVALDDGKLTRTEADLLERLISAHKVKIAGLEGAVRRSSCQS